MTSASTQTDDHFCLTCHYNLRGLTSSRCPECGRVFEPADPRTFYRGHRGKPMSRFSQWQYRRIRWPMPVIALTLASISLYVAASPGVPSPRVTSRLVSAWTLLLLFWFIRCLGILSVSSRYGAPRCGRWPMLPAYALIATLVVSWLNVPLHVGFLMSKPAMDRLAAQAGAYPHRTDHPDQLVGIYSARGVQTFFGGVRFSVHRKGRAGFAYLPGHVPTGSRAPRYRRLSGRWYTFQEEGITPRWYRAFSRRWGWYR